MNNLLLKLFVRLQLLINQQDGQDIVEYSMLVALIALAAVSGTREVASAVNTTFGKISTSLA